jgi:hypothetical protein
MVVVAPGDVGKTHLLDNSKDSIGILPVCRLPKLVPATPSNSTWFVTLYSGMSKVAKNDLGERVGLETLRGLRFRVRSLGVVNKDIVLGKVTLMYRLSHLCE